MTRTRNGGDAVVRPAEASCAPGTVRRALTLAVPAMWVLGVLAWECSTALDAQLVPLLAAAPALACLAGRGHRGGVLFAGACALFALYPLGQVAPYGDVAGRAGTCAAILAVVGADYFAAARRTRLRRELARAREELVRAREAATAAQEALLRPLPSRVETFDVAAGHLSATRGAEIGGDLYAVVATRYGVRVVIGDVRGHGLAAVATVSAVLGTFREAAYDEPELGGVMRRLERGLARHLYAEHAEEQDDREAGEPRVTEEFVTVLLLQVCGADASADAAATTATAATTAGTEALASQEPPGPADTVTLLNCGHPWPYRLCAPDEGPLLVERISETESLPPLGLFPLPRRLPVPLELRLPCGDALFLYTDGAEDARDAGGAYFELADVLRTALAERAAPAGLIDAVCGALREHTGDRFSDDVALLALRDDRCRPVPELTARAVPSGAFAESPPRPAAHVPHPRV